MPQAVAAAAAAFAATLGATAVVVSTVYAFTYVSTIYLINRAIKSLSPKPPKGLGRSLEANYQATDAGAPIIFGEARVGGMECIPPLTTGTDGRYLHRVHALAAHQCSSFEAAYFDDTAVDNSAFGSITGTDSDGVAGSGAGKYQGKAWLRTYMGTATQNVDYILSQIDATGFPSTFRGRGITYAAIRYRFDSDVFTGIPAQSYVIRGAIAYDPRLDSSPGNDPTNASYIAWTQNPALLLTWYLMNTTIGGAYDSSEIDWSTVVTAANTCDANVSIPTSSSQDRYTCNGMLLASNDFLENVKIIVDSMLGRVIFRDGKWRVHAGQWQTPTFDILKSDWCSPISITFEGGRDKRFARAKCWYVDASRNWQRVECKPRYNSSYYAADGNEWNDTEFEQSLCNNEYEAQRKTEMLLRQSRNQVIIAGKLPPRFQDIALWDTGAISDPDLGWSEKTFRCVGLNINPDGSVDGVFQEEQESDWADLAEGDYNNASTAALPAINPTTASEPNNFTVTSLYGTISFDWDDSIVRPVGTRYRIIRSPGSASAVQSGTVVWQGDTTNAIYDTQSYAPAWYHVQAFVGSNYSPYQPNTYGAFGRPYIAEGSLGNRLFPDGELMYALNSYWDFPHPAVSEVWSLDGGNGRSGIQGSITLTGTNGYLSGNQQRFRCVVPNNDPTPDRPKISPSQSIGIVLSYMRVESAVTDFVLECRARNYSSKLSNVEITLVTTQIFVSSLSVGQWRTEIIPVTMPSSPITHLELGANWYSAYGTSGRVRIGTIQAALI